MNISPSVTETVSLSPSAAALDAGADDAGVLASALLEAALLVGALLDGAASAASSPEQPLSRPIPRARTSGAAERAERAGPVAWGTRDLLGADGTPPRRRLPVVRDAAGVKHPGEPPDSGVTTTRALPSRSEIRRTRWREVPGRPDGAVPPGSGASTGRAPAGAACASGRGRAGSRPVRARSRRGRRGRRPAPAGPRPR